MGRRLPPGPDRNCNSSARWRGREQTSAAQLGDQVHNLGSRRGPIQAGGHRLLRDQVDSEFDRPGHDRRREPPADCCALAQPAEDKHTGAGAEQAVGGDEEFRTPHARGAQSLLSRCRYRPLLLFRDAPIVPVRPVRLWPV